MGTVITLPGLGDFRDLPVWREAMELVETIYALSEDFRDENPFGLAAQMRGAAIVVPAKIAGGHAQGATEEAAISFSFASGSLAELRTHLESARRLGLAEAAALEPVEAVCEKIAALLEELHTNVFFAL